MHACVRVPQKAMVKRIKISQYEIIIIIQLRNFMKSEWPVCLTSCVHEYAHACVRVCTQLYTATTERACYQYPETIMRSWNHFARTLFLITSQSRSWLPNNKFLPRMHLFSPSYLWRPAVHNGTGTTRTGYVQVHASTPKYIGHLLSDLIQGGLPKGWGVTTLHQSHEIALIYILTNNNRE